MQRFPSVTQQTKILTVKAVERASQCYRVPPHSPLTCASSPSGGDELEKLVIGDTARLRMKFCNPHKRCRVVWNKPALHLLSAPVAESTYGARRGDGIGDLGVLYELEEGLRKLNISADIIRAPYYMSNWDASLETARAEGIVHTLYPLNFKLPMAAPKDIGRVAAELLMKDNDLFGFISGYEKREYKDQDPVNIKAAEAVGKLHDALSASGYTEHRLEVFLVRLVYCLFADDTGIFPKDHFRFFP